MWKSASLDLSSKMHAVWAASQEAKVLFRSQPSNGQTGLAENEGSSSKSSDNDYGGRNIGRYIREYDRGVPSQPNNELLGRSLTDCPISRGSTLHI